MEPLIFSAERFFFSFQGEAGNGADKRTME